jgi:DedD protein
MNQELKHRLIGAVVVTALATIFIPMLFDDPIDDTGQLVSELKIPAEPGKSGENPENKSPTSVGQVMDRSGEDSESSGKAQNDLAASDAGSTDGAISDESEQVENNDIVQSQSADMSDTYAEEEMEQGVDGSQNGQLKENKEPESLDTGMVEESNKPAHVDKTANIPNRNQGQTGSKDINPKPINHEPAVPPQKPLKEPAINAVNPVAPQSNMAKHLTAEAVEGAKKPANATKVIANKPDQQLVRYYLQAGSFGRKDNAMALLETLRKQGLPAQLETVQGDKRALYRLKVGPELSKKRALDMKAKLEKQKISALLIAE